MDKRVIFAVAGSGKTSSIIEQVNEGSRCLIVTYTDNNASQLKLRIIRKFGKIPNGVRIYTYFTFLYSFCYRPIYGYTVKSKGINFSFPLPDYVQRSRKNTLTHYLDKNNRLYANRIAKLLIEYDIVSEVIERIQNFFDIVCVDEVQDFAANDFNFLCCIANANVEMRLVGDFFQHTFDTSRDGNTQRNLHSCFVKYSRKLDAAGYLVDLDSLSHSFRCSPSVCAFVENNLGIKIESHRTDHVDVRLISIDAEIEAIFLDNSIVKLFYQKSNSYQGYTDNWGNTKGLDDFHDVCVVLNPNTYKAYRTGSLDQLAPTTINKLYVACTRSKGNLYFISEEQLKKYKL